MLGLSLSLTHTHAHRERNIFRHTDSVQCVPLINTSIYSAIIQKLRVASLHLSINCIITISVVMINNVHGNGK